MQIEVKGLASGTSRFLSVAPQDLKEILLYWLRKNQVTIASSCDGEGICRKCVIQNEWLTCELTLEEFLKREPTGLIKITYL